jgi:hypothetical protein
VEIAGSSGSESLIVFVEGSHEEGRHPGVEGRGKRGIKSDSGPGVEGKMDHFIIDPAGGLGELPGGEAGESQEEKGIKNHGGVFFYFWIHDGFDTYFAVWGSPVKKISH